MIVGAAILAALQSPLGQGRVSTESDTAKMGVASYQMRSSLQRTDRYLCSSRFKTGRFGPTFDEPEATSALEEQWSLCVSVSLW